VADPPAIRILTDDHAEVHGQGGAVSEAEVDHEVAEHHAVAKRARFEQRVRRGQAKRLGGEVLGDARPTV